MVIATYFIHIFFFNLTKNSKASRARWGIITQKETFNTDPQAEAKFKELLGEMGF